MTGSLEGVVGLLTILGGIGATISKTFKYVHEGELGIKLRFGRALRNKKTGEPRIIKPGFVMMIPFAESLRTHHVRQQTIHLGGQEVMIKGGLTFKVSAVIIFKVKDIYRALFEIDELENSLTDLGMGILREEFSTREFSSVGDTHGISEKLLAAIREKSDEWGIEIIAFPLTNCAPTSESTHLTNLLTGADMKYEALERVAKRMGIEVSDLNSTLGAVLVGMPFQATNHQNFTTNNQFDGEDDAITRKLDLISDSLSKITDKIS